MSSLAARPRLVSGEFASLLLVNLVFNGAASIFHLLPKFAARELGASASEVGALIGVFGLGSFIGMPLVARYLARTPSRSAVRTGTRLMLFTCVAFMWVERVGPSLYGLRALQAVAFSLVINAGSSITAQLAPADRLAQALGLYASAGMIMNALGPAVAEWVADHGHFTHAFALAGAAAVCALFLTRRLPSERPERAPTSGIASLVHVRNSGRMVLILAAVGLGFGAMFAFSQPYALALGVANMRSFFFAFTVAALLVRLTFGGHIDRLGHKRVATFSLLGYAAVVAGMAALTPHRLVLFGALFGLTHGIFIPSFQALVISGRAGTQRNLLLTLYNGAFNLGQCLVVVLGISAEHTGYPWVYLATGGFLFVSALVLHGWSRAPDARLFESTRPVAETRLPS